MAVFFGDFKNVKGQDIVGKTKLVDKIIKTNGRFFTVLFNTRSNRGLRLMTCKVNADALEAGLAKNLIPVYDVIKKGYRNIPIEGIIHAVIDNKYIRVKR